VLNLYAPIIIMFVFITAGIFGPCCGWLHFVRPAASSQSGETAPYECGNHAGK